MITYDYHQPVLLSESIDWLITDQNGVYLDVTYGGGGHSREVLGRLDDQALLIGVDQDLDAQQNIIDDDRLLFVQSNFSYITRFLDYYEIEGVDGILADLGVSSHHFDEAERGFSYRYDALLDMRMNQSAKHTAADILNGYSVQDLQAVLSTYGEVRNSKTLASAIVESRRVGKVEMVADLERIIDRVYRGDRQRYSAQVYQALRIEVNEELEVLKDMLLSAMHALKSGGRLVVISYHSLEDKLVKQLFKDNNFEKKKMVDEFGRSQNILEPLIRKPIVPTEQEIEKNSRAASAKMRVAQKK
jgi:16S rRNA (cytosine1402-N4)-methyltransferase